LSQERLRFGPKGSDRLTGIAGWHSHDLHGRFDGGGIPYLDDVI
jgi:hypothetical protein